MARMLEHRAGFVSIVGRPNAGKSTLLNTLVGDKVAIVSDKAQTTRTAIQGVLTRPEAQVVFLDTPGIHKAGSLLNRRMMDSVHGALEERDLLIYIADCRASFNQEDAQALDLIRKLETPSFLVLNKIDALDNKHLLLPLLEKYQSLHAFAEFIPISALTGEGLDRLIELVIARLPEGPPFFPDDFITDQPERFLAAELIREKILSATRQEVPHSIAVVVENWEEDGRLTRIAATIFVERAGQKAIVIGSKGAMLKQIGTQARAEMESLLSRKIFLELFVKVQPDWRDNPRLVGVIDWHAPLEATGGEFVKELDPEADSPQE
jgi:GTP-binding protein Era